MNIALYVVIIYALYVTRVRVRAKQQECNSWPVGKKIKDISRVRIMSKTDMYVQVSVQNSHATQNLVVFQEHNSARLRDNVMMFWDKNDCYYKEEKDYPRITNYNVLNRTLFTNLLPTVKKFGLMWHVRDPFVNSEFENTERSQL